MALRQLLITKRISALTAQLDEQTAKDAGFAERSTALKTREADLEAAVNELPDDAPEEDRTAIDELADEFEADKSALEKEQGEHEDSKQRLADEIQKLTSELDELNKNAAEPPKAEPRSERKGEKINMEARTKFFGMTRSERDAFFVRDDVKGFISAIRESLKTRAVNGSSLTVPDVILDILRDNFEQYSVLAKYVTVKSIKGTARQNIMGTAPEGVWMEVAGELNELDLTLNQVEVDGYMVGGFIPIHNSLLMDSDIALGGEIVSGLGKAIGKGVDRGILYGTGTNMPVGIVTRLAQTSAPSNWGADAPAWTDLHSTNIKKLNINGTTGAAFFASLVESLGIAKPNYSDGRAFWVMNRKTHISLMTKALAFDAAAALVAGVHNQMPIIGGDIVEYEEIGDYEIVGGYGSVYLLAQREGANIESSEHVRFLKNQTVYKGYARFDGLPVFGEAFVMVSYDNSDAASTSTFPTDYANTELGVLGVTAAAGSGAGKTVLTVTGTEDSGTTLKYKVGDITVTTGNKAVGFTAMTSGTTNIVAASGTLITVVELDADGRVIKSGKAAAVNP